MSYLPISGRLGLGHEEDCCTPQEVKINTEEVYIVNVRCSGAATILMSDSGALYACGENNDNRLGLTEDSWTSWFTYEPADERGEGPKVRILEYWSFQNLKCLA